MVEKSLKKIKIVHIITRLDKGGSTENVLMTCQLLDLQKYDPILLYGYSVDFQLLQTSYKTYCIPELIREISPIKDFIAFFKIYSILKTLKPDIVHTHSSKAGFLGRWAAHLLRLTSYNLQFIKIVHTPHGHVFYGYFGRLKSLLFLILERLTAKITDKFIALTDGEKNESLSYGVGMPHQWTVIHSGVETTNYKLQITNYKLRRELHIPENAVVVGTVARLEPVKGVKYFINAIPIINAKCQLQNLKFLIVGDGSERKNLEFITKNLGLNNKVIFTGMRDDIQELISIMDIYVQPSLNEGMGKTIVLAALLAKPIVATNVQGIPDVILNGKTGILVESKNKRDFSKKLAEAILKFISDESLRKEFGDASKKYVTELVDGYQKFSPERMIFLLEKLYYELKNT